MLKPLLVATLIYLVSAIAFTIYFYLDAAKGVGWGTGGMTHRVLLLLFYGSLRWALVPTAPYLVYEFIVKRY